MGLIRVIAEYFDWTVFCGRFTLVFDMSQSTEPGSDIMAESE